MKILCCTLITMTIAIGDLRAQRNSLAKTSFQDSSNWEQASCFKMRDLAGSALHGGDKNFANRVAKKYMVDCLDEGSDTVLLTRENLQFILTFPSCIDSKDRFFWNLVNHWSLVELLPESDGVNSLIDHTITKDDIEPLKQTMAKSTGHEPNWKVIYNRIEDKYGRQYAKRLIPAAELQYYESNQKWSKYARTFDNEIREFIPKTGGRVLGGILDDVWELNVKAWDVFMHCADKEDLKLALKWSILSIQLCQNNGELIQLLDTKANILYKMGNKSEALPIEQSAVELSGNNPVYRTTLVKMKNGEATWTENEGSN